jgi:hypothetical protein
MLMDLRRSPIWGPIITMAAATIDLQLDRLPRRVSTTPRGAAARSPHTTASTLDSMGVSKAQSSNWQALADIPEDEFERTIA